MGFLDINNATKSYGSVEVLHRVDITVQEGEFLVLVGPSGCGKSTLLNMIAGLEEISSGEIAIKGQVMNGVHPSKRNIAMVFQSYALYPNMTVGQNITFGLEMHGIPKPERDQALEKVSAMLQINQLLDRKPGQLSGGQRQRVAMGRAIVREPDVFLFDEPLSNLDAKLCVQMRLENRELQAKLDVTSLYVTHDQVEAMTMADRMIVMNEGHAEQIGTPLEVYERPATLFAAQFIGSPSMNVLEAEATEGRVELRNGASLPISSAYRGPALVGFRPEHMITGPSGPLEIELHLSEPLGANTLLHGRLGGTGEALTCSLPGVHRVNGEDRNITASVAQENLHLFDPSSGHRID